MTYPPLARRHVCPPGRCELVDVRVAGPSGDLDRQAVGNSRAL